MKEYLKKERDKISRIDGWSAKTEYIWQYYKLWIIGIAVLIFFSVFAIRQYFFQVNENWFYITFTNTYAEVGDGSDLWKGYVEYTGYDLKEKNVVFNNSSYFDYKEGVTGNSYFQAFVAYTEGGTLDAITMETDSLTALGESGRLIDLNSEECASIREKYGDRFLYCIPLDTEYSTEPVPVGIDISDSILMTRYHMYNNSCGLGIGAKSGDIDAVEAFLDYLYSEDAR
ncbi:MAG: hypothetical protein Q4B85_09885 [Lachnospiraceae bacterium]|nr:hypothetical protein [Lachnospiraceae bacterium]